MGKAGQAAAAAAVLLVTLAARGAGPGASSPEWADIEAYVRGQMEAHGIPGLALAIVREGRVVSLRGFGVSGPKGRPVTARTPFRMGALSRTLTAAAVMQLAEAGRLELDAPVQRYLPWFRVADPAASSALTVRHLLTHTSGLPPSADDVAGERPTLEERVRALAAVTPTAPPGARYQETGADDVVLGLLVEQVSGEPYPRYVEQHVFRPLGMARCFTSEEEARHFGLAHGYRLWAGTPRPVDVPVGADRLPAAGLVCSAEDLARFLVAQMHGASRGQGPLLSPVSLVALQAPAARAEGFGSALGWRVGTTAGAPSLWQVGLLTGHGGALVLQPEEGWGVVVLSNLGSGFEDTARRIAQGVTARLVGRPAPEDGVPLRQASRLAVAALVLSAGVLLWRLMHLQRWQERRAVKLASPTGRKQVLAQLWVDLALPLLAPLALPPLTGRPLVALYQGLPDVTAGLALLLALGALLAAVRLRRVLATPVR